MFACFGDGSSAVGPPRAWASRAVGARTGASRGPCGSARSAAAGGFCRPRRLRRSGSRRLMPRACVMPRDPGSGAGATERSSKHRHNSRTVSRAVPYRAGDCRALLRELGCRRRHRVLRFSEGEPPVESAQAGESTSPRQAGSAGTLALSISCSAAGSPASSRALSSPSRAATKRCLFPPYFTSEK